MILKERLGCVEHYFNTSHRDDENGIVCTCSYDVKFNKTCVVMIYIIIIHVNMITERQSMSESRVIVDLARITYNTLYCVAYTNTQGCVA